MPCSDLRPRQLSTMRVASNLCQACARLLAPQFFFVSVGGNSPMSQARVPRAGLLVEQADSLLVVYECTHHQL